MASHPDITALALRTLEDALAQAHHGLVRRTWGQRLALTWLIEAGLAQEWQARKFWQTLADSHAWAPSEIYARDLRLATLIGFLDNWTMRFGAVVPDCLQRERWAKGYGVNASQPQK